MKSIQYNLQQRTLQQEFVACGLLARDEARQTGKYISAEEMLAGLDETLAKLSEAHSCK